jgi:signal transduction histidine kinase
MNGAKAAGDADLQLFAAAVAHEIRTPLTALSGEIEVALRRDRSPEEYREVLRRIAAPLSDLVAISSDLTLLSDPVDRSVTGSRSARLDAILARLHDRFHNTRAVQIESLPAAHVQVAGDEQRLSRAITLIVEHALRYRRPDSPVVVRIRAAAAGVCMDIDALPSGFWPHTWSSVGAAAMGPADPLRLRTARRILDESGSALVRAGDSEWDGVRVELRAGA